MAADCASNDKVSGSGKAKIFKCPEKKASAMMRFDDEHASSPATVHFAGDTTYSPINLLCFVGDNPDFSSHPPSPIRTGKPSLGLRSRNTGCRE
jgi:hypothetical protein